MKNTIKQCVGLLTGAMMALALAAVAPQSARAADGNLLALQVKELSKNRVAQRVDHTSSTCLNLDYVGTSTAAFVNILRLSTTFYAPFNVADTSIGTSGGGYDLSAAAYDTMGEFCDAVDATANYECTLVGCKRDDNTSRLRDQTVLSGTNDLKAAGGFNVQLDTGSTELVTAAVFDIRVGINPATDKQVILKTCTGNINVAGTIRVYGKLARYAGVDDGVTRNDTTEVWRAATTDDTDLQIPVDLTESGWLEFAKNAHVVISGGNGTGEQAAANFLECQWDER